MEASAYLTALLRAFLTGEEPKKWEGGDWAELTELARIHNASGILGYMDMRHAICPEEEQRARLRKVCLSTMSLYAQRAARAEAFLALLTEKGIPCCPMKGIEIRSLYPIPELRSFSDVDLLIRTEDRTAVHKLMLDTGFQVKTDWEPVYSYLRGQEYYEIHTRIMEIDLSDKADYRGYFDKAWQYTVSRGGCRYSFTPEFHFIYLLTHLAKHVQGSGAGIRMYLDIAVFVLHYEKSLDWAYVRRELESLSLWQFACTVLSCVESWFGVACPMELDRPGAELLERFAKFTLEAGVFGKHGREAGLSSLKKEASASRLTVLFKRLFPNARSIEQRYTYLQGRPWLLPVAWVHRFFKTDISVKAHAREAKNIMTADESEVDRLKKISKDIGL